MAVTLPITDPILASLAELEPSSNNDEPGFGLYDRRRRDGEAAEEHDGHVYEDLRGARARRLFWLEFDALEQEAVEPLPPGAPTSLRQFGQLPAEIRLQVWAAALRQQRRVITVTCHSADSTYLSGVPGQCVYDRMSPQRWSPALLPVLFRVSREALADLAEAPARIFTAGHQPVSSPETRDRPQHSLTSIPKNTYRRPGGHGCLFNFETDVLLLQGDLEPHDDAATTSMVYFLSRDDTRRVRHVACSAIALGVGRLQPELLFARLFPIVDRFHIVDRLVVVTPPTTAGNDGDDGDDSTGCGSQHQKKPIRYDDICQQVWSRWTNSQNMPQLLGAVDGEADGQEGSTVVGSNENSNGNSNANGNATNNNDMLATLYYSPSSRKDRIRIITVPQDQLQAYVADR
ncbi:hypothetical protein CMQ_3822 [Grosmannia clavigera kw1407]|uniref:2EXR domain-containing protein n=1 Tax=Grosmannia clavigera (strain kw1407 / UAMH 11150) TaxID=655863 RepID=F0XA58_GROCL|nr:uncharacterized protein CMQ_3822 [Grosmannia clavigera kw1407]EFX05753.1 hypothetical protein CMQ_3822 [Grosmannia clavigera kw1407]